MVKVIESEIIDLGGKVKFPRCEVIFTGSQKDATDILVKEYGACGNIIGAMVVVDDKQHAIAGKYGTAMTGYGGTATAGDEGTATAGNRGTATAGHGGTATAGIEGTATAGYEGTATAGKYGTAMAGDWGTATAGDWGTATAGDWGTAMAGELGRISIFYWDGIRYREVIGYIGENGLLPNVPYVLNNKHEFVRKT